MRRFLYRSLSLWGLTNALLRGPWYVLRFALRAMLIRDILRWL